MRRGNLSILLGIPAANALSLANFQSITSSSIPLTCQLAYDSQIPTCTVSDFNDGCSASCVSALNSIANTVTNSCSNVKVKSNTLLGIVMSGDIVAALCPEPEQTTTKSSAAQVTSASAAPVSPAIASVTLPTTSGGVTGGLGLKSSSSLILPSSTSQTSKTTLHSTVSTTAQSANGGLGGESSTTSTSSTTNAKKTSATASKATTSATSQSDSTNKSGGGSPFDVAAEVSNDAPRLGSSIMALVVALCAVILAGR